MNLRSPILFTAVTLIAALSIWFTVQPVSTPNIARAQVDFSCTNVSDIPLAECEALVI